MIQKGVYRHYKGELYEVVNVAKHSETLEPMVVYRALYEDHSLWVRPLKMFLEFVDEGLTPRFEFVSEKGESPKGSCSLISIQTAIQEDILPMVALSLQKRLSYEMAQPQFWKHAPEAETSQAKWFEALLSREDTLMLTAKRGDEVVGFVISSLVKAPEVYDPGGFTLMIDDFCVADANDWTSVGIQLINDAVEMSRDKGIVQLLVVCGAHDEPKRKFLKAQGLICASEWYVGGEGFR